MKEEDIEMSPTPTSTDGVGVQEQKMSKHADVERNTSIASDGRKRSKLQMVAIVTALFVCLQ